MGLLLKKISTISTNSQNFFQKILGIGHWEELIDAKARALMWLNLYGYETIRCKLKNRQKFNFFCVFRLFLSLCRTASTI